MGRVDSSDLDHCLYCGVSLTGFDCWRCKVEFVYEGDTLQTHTSRAHTCGYQNICES